MATVIGGLLSPRLAVVLGACAVIGFLVFASIPLVQTPPDWTSALSILASELVGGACLLAFFLRRQLALHGDNPFPDETMEERDTRWTRNTVLIFGVLGLIVLFVLSVGGPPQTVRATARLFGMAALYAGAFFAVGALIGFLFGIPRSLQGKREQKPDSKSTSNDVGKDSTATPSSSDIVQSVQNPTYAPNTNLEEISDWLTKIIVGLGLVNLKTIPGNLTKLAQYFDNFSDNRFPEGVCLAIILYFFTCGFFLAYLMTRLYLTAAFTRADRAAALERVRRRNEVNKKVESVMQETENSSLSEAGGDILPLIERQALGAKVIASIAGTTNKPNFQVELETLAHKYDALRDAMKASDERTRQMEAIAAGMRSYALTSTGLLDRFAAGSTPGERLVAVSFLEVQPDCRYLNWLSARFVEDTQPFLQYHAAIGLQAAALKLGDQCKDQIRVAVQRAVERLGIGKEGTDRLKVLQMALKAVSE